jgi:hypothetical protein
MGMSPREFRDTIMRRRSLNPFGEQMNENGTQVMMEASHETFSSSPRFQSHI